MQLLTKDAPHKRGFNTGSDPDVGYDLLLIKLQLIKSLTLHLKTFNCNRNLTCSQKLVAPAAIWRKQSKVQQHPKWSTKPFSIKSKPQNRWMV